MTNDILTSDLTSASTDFVPYGGEDEHPVDVFAPLIYVAGPLGDDLKQEANVDRAIDYADLIQTFGGLAEVPHLCVRWHAQHPHTYEEWMSRDMAMIRRCDALYRMPGISPGADREVDFARAIGVPVFEDIASLARWIRRYLEALRRPG